MTDLFHTRKSIEYKAFRAEGKMFDLLSYSLCTLIVSIMRV